MDGNNGGPSLDHHSSQLTVIKIICCNSSSARPLAQDYFILPYEHEGDGPSVKRLEGCPLQTVHRGPLLPFPPPQILRCPEDEIKVHQTPERLPVQLICTL